MIRDASVFRLPVLPFAVGDRVVTAYRAEREAIRTVEDLRRFSRRWRYVWRLKIPPPGQHIRLHRTEVRLVRSTYDAARVLRCLREIRKRGRCRHMGRKRCEGISLMLPAPLLLAGLIASRYGVAVDVALIQMTAALFPDADMSPFF